MLEECAQKMLPHSMTIYSCYIHNIIVYPTTFGTVMNWRHKLGVAEKDVYLPTEVFAMFI